MNMQKHLDKLKQRIITMRERGIEISPAVELVILKEAEFAYKAGAFDSYKECAQEIGLEKM